MEKQPRVLGAFRQCALHLVPRFSQLARRSQRPGKRIVTEDITARVKFCSRKSKRRLRRLVSRCEKERQRPRIAARAALAKLHFDSSRFIFTASCTQRLG